ncbi:hypothetical protein HOD88_00515 [archaeon]|jgi:hypothetical protein|nr:hypothetical protein [archaeon]
MASIGEIVNTNEIVLLDNSAINWALGEDQFSLSNPNVIYQFKRRSRYIGRLRGQLIDEDAPFYITPGILDEFSGKLQGALDLHADFSRGRKKCRKKKERSSRGFINNSSITSAVEKEQRARRLFVEELTARGRILSLKDFGKIQGRDFDAAYAELSEQDGLSWQDYEFLKVGYLVSREVGPVSLISNDGAGNNGTGISYAWKRVVGREKIPFEEFGFYFRIGEDEYFPANSSNLSQKLGKAKDRKDLENRV